MLIKETGVSEMSTVHQQHHTLCEYTLDIRANMKHVCNVIKQNEMELATSGITGRGHGGRVPPRDFQPKNFC